MRAKRQATGRVARQLRPGTPDRDPGEHLVVIGGFNAFEANDGYRRRDERRRRHAAARQPDRRAGRRRGSGESRSRESGRARQRRPSATRRCPDGNARNVDHVLVSAGLVAATTARRIEHPRIGADYPETDVRRRRDRVAVLRSRSGRGVPCVSSAAPRRSSRSASPTPPIPSRAGQPHLHHHRHQQRSGCGGQRRSLSDTLPAGHDVRVAGRARRLVVQHAGGGCGRHDLVLEPRR